MRVAGFWREMQIPRAHSRLTGLSARGMKSFHDGLGEVDHEHQARAGGDGLLWCGCLGDARAEDYEEPQGTESVSV